VLFQLRYRIHTFRLNAPSITVGRARPFIWTPGLEKERRLKALRDDPLEIRDENDNLRLRNGCQPMSRRATLFEKVLERLAVASETESKDVFEFPRKL